MPPTPPDLDSTLVKLQLARKAYTSNTVRLVETRLAGFTHIMASRQGLFAISNTHCVLLIHGLFFGITFRGEDIFVFESCDLPRSHTRRGRLLKLTVRNNTVVETKIILKNLDNGYHQIDFIHGRLLMVDTYFQRILSVDVDTAETRTIAPLPEIVSRGEGRAYFHINSILGVGPLTLVLLHNGGKPHSHKSQVMVYNAEWNPIERWDLNGTGCHSLALQPDGSLLSCGSMQGTLIAACTDLAVSIGPNLTRGLSVGEHTIAVGSSELIERAGRLRNAGTVTFLDRAFHIQSVLPVPAAPTELRRLDAKDAGLSSWLVTQPWGNRLNGIPAEVLPASAATNPVA